MKAPRNCGGFGGIVLGGHHRFNNCYIINETLQHSRRAIFSKISNFIDFKRDISGGYAPLYESLKDYPDRALKMLRPTMCISAARAIGGMGDKTAATPLLVTEDSPFGSGFIAWGLLPGLRVARELCVGGESFLIHRDWRSLEYIEDKPGLFNNTFAILFVGRAALPETLQNRVRFAELHPTYELEYIEDKPGLFKKPGFWSAPRLLSRSFISWWLLFACRTRKTPVFSLGATPVYLLFV